MIQELFGGVEERKVSIPAALSGLLGVDTPCSSSLINSSSSSPSSTSSAAAEQRENLRCPRCDSSNTKFCYYNNYNLTQPRHFCKTCRRYWTKGGALRNVPIGGGCRKAKPSLSVTAAGVKPGNAGKARPASPDFTGLSGLAGGLGNEVPASSVMWPSPHSSHLLALLRGAGIQNPNPSPISGLNSVRIKEDGAMIGSHMVAEPVGGGALNVQNLSLDPMGHLTIGPCGSLWKNQTQYQYHHHQQQQHQQQHNLLLGGEAPSSGIHELYQRMRSSANYYSDHLQAIVNNGSGSSAASCSTTTSTTAVMANTMDATSTSNSIIDPIPLAGGDFGYWNPALAWSDLPASNAAFP